MFAKQYFVPFTSLLIQTSDKGSIDRLLIFHQRCHVRRDVSVYFYSTIAISNPPPPPPLPDSFQIDCDSHSGTSVC